MATRRERVVLDLEDNFTPGAARAAAAAALLKREVDGLNGAGSRSSGGVEKVAKDVDKLSTSAVKGSKEIDKYSGRLRLLADVALILGPASVTVGVGLAGMAVSAGVAGLALYGLGDALTALNKYQLEPTKANLETLNQEMAKAGPAGREFVLFLDSLGPQLTDLQMVARAGFLPGLQDGIESLMTRFPEVRTIVADLAAELGDLAAKGGEWLAGPGFDQFQEFLAYARAQGPAVADFTRALAGTLIGLGKAMAPVGQVTLPILTNLLDVLAQIANSPIGPALVAAATAFTIVSRSAQLADFAMGRFGASSEKAKSSLGGFAGKAAGIVLVGQALGSVVNQLGVGVGINSADLSRDIDRITSGGATDSLNELAKSLENINEVGGGTVNALLALPSAVTGIQTSFSGSKEVVEQFDQQLAQLVEGGHADQAAVLFERIRAAAKERGGVSDADVVKSFDSYKTALENAADGADSYGHAANNATVKTATWVEQIRNASDAMIRQRSAALGAFDAVTQYGQALDAARAAAAKGKRGIDANTAAGRENRQALSQLAAAWNNQSDAVRNNSDKFRKARSDFIATATAMGVPAAAARRLARQLLEIPNSKVIKVSAETQQARSDLAAIIAMAQGVPRTIRTDYIVNQVNRINTIRVGGRDGDPSTPYWTGGYTGKGDKYEPAGIVHRGEFVFSADATKGHERELAMLQKRLRGYASGGLVGSSGAFTPDWLQDILSFTAGGHLHGGGGGGRSNQLTGFGTWLSVAELGVRISNLTVGQIRGLGKEMDDLGKKKLRGLGKALDKATEIQSKQTEAAKSALEAVQSKRSDLAGSVASGLTRNLWDSQGGGGVFSSQYASGSIGAANDRLRQQIADSRDFTRLEGALANRGVTGAALQNLLAEGGIDALRMAASASNADLRTYQTLYGQAQTYAGRAGQGAGTLVYGAAEARAQAYYDKQYAETKAMRQEIHELRVELKKHPEKTGAAVARAHDKNAKNARSR